MRRIVIALAAWALCSSWAGAAQIVQFSPKGTVVAVQSVKLALDVPAVAFGDSQAAAPVDVVCNDPAAKGEGRWLDEWRWTYEFTAALGPGVRCTVDVRKEFRSLTNEPITGKTQFTFQTGGPRVAESRPWDVTIAEDQAFVLRFDGAVDSDSVLAHSRCLVEGLGEAVPLRLIAGEARQDILKAAYLRGDDAAIQVLQCKRRLPAEAKVQLSVGPGIATPAAGRTPVASTKADVFDYTVRKPFKATMTCLRENSSMPCTPVAPIAVEFTAPISQSDAAGLRLKTPSDELSPSTRKNETYLGPVTRVEFNGPFPELSNLTLTLPQGLKDESGRDLVNADQFPLTVPVAGYPPLVKFAAAAFGIIERFAEARPGVDDADVQASVPLTVRNVEAELKTKELAVSAGKVSDYVAKDDAEVLRWYARVRRLENGRWTAGQLEDIMADRQPRQDDKPIQDARAFSALKDLKDVRELSLPGLAEDGLRPFEVVGVPMDKPGFHVLEVASARLGKALIASGKPMVVRSAVLVTNLGVHVKKGRDDLLAWVTTLDDGVVVADADIAVLDCSGAELARGRTGADGIWHHKHPVAAPDYCEDTGLSGVYVSARIAGDHPQARGKADFSFVFSDWNRGIESWRFNVPTDFDPTPTMVTHTVFDRTLLRAGETVAMKHFARVQTRDGLALPDLAERMPDRVIIEHQGSDQRYEQNVSWKKTPSGGLSAAGHFDIPRSARLGVYTVRLTDAEGGWYGTSEFRVEEFKLPLLAGKLQITGGQAGAVVAPHALDADIQISYVSGGAASRLPVQLSAVLKNRRVSFPGYEDYSFDAPIQAGHEDSAMASPQDEAEDEAKPVLFLDKKAVTLDEAGSARVAVDNLPVIDRPRTMLFEAGFSDPNGQIQTLAQSVPVWPARIQAGIRAGNWLRAGVVANLDAIALSPDGKPQAGVAMQVRAVAKTTYSTRKRLVGGFYGYDSHTETRDLGMLCEGATGANGVMPCSAALDHSGSVEVVAVAMDSQKQVSQAATSVWVTGADDLWFGGENDDRIDVIPAKKVWAPGETATFQVRMPFRQATALLAIEREGVLQTRVVHLSGKDPSFSIPIDAAWGPNVYVSVLALRGRIHDVPWYSFFASGWKSPASWRDAFMAARKDYVAPTALIDLAKPAFRYGLAEIQVTDRQDQLDVEVSTNKSRYQPRDQVDVSIAVTLPDGTPAAHGTVAFAAVDQALLELAPNTSWDLLGAMRQFRSYGVETATAQLEVVGRRHYGRKALPAGGGGGKSPTRELLDTLLLWQPAIQLDDQGRARVSVKLNDAITQFKLVAVADYGTNRYGTGSASVASSQDLQVIPGLPALVREGDQYGATATVRNSTSRAMRIEVGASYSGKGIAAGTLETKQVMLEPGSARQLSWPARAPDSMLQDSGTIMKWIFEAHERPEGETAADRGQNLAADRLVYEQTLVPAVPVQTRQATMVAIEASTPLSLPISTPKGALANADGRVRGGVQVHVQSSLGGGLPGVLAWFAAYPYTCFEQVASRAMALRDSALWQGLMHRLPDYLDEDGLVAYFPGATQGSEVLTAYLLSATHEARSLGLPFDIPDASRRAMTNGLLAFVQGKLVRYRWAPQRDLDVRKLLVLEALSRQGLVRPRMLGSIVIDPAAWPTSALIDWMAILQRVRGIPEQGARLKQARQLLLARMTVRGTELVFSPDARNDSWWLMMGPEVNQARLILAVMDQASWRDDLPRLSMGLLGMQRNGAWRTTTGNLLGSLAMEKFSQIYEKVPVTGQVNVQLTPDGAPHVFKWATDSTGPSSSSSTGPSSSPATASSTSTAASTATVPSSHDVFLDWKNGTGQALSVMQQGAGRPWVTVRSMAAVPATKPITAGYALERRITPISQAVAGRWSQGDVYRVTLKINATSATTWSVLTDPIPAGATILGSGLGRDSSILNETKAQQEDWRWQPTFVERSFASYRAYYDYLPAGQHTLTYTVRLNTAGQFDLPPTRIEAMYQPDVYGGLPNEGRMSVLEPAAKKK